MRINIPSRKHFEMNAQIFIKLAWETQKLTRKYWDRQLMDSPRK